MTGGGLQTGGDLGMTGSLIGTPALSCVAFLCIAWSTAALCSALCFPPDPSLRACTEALLPPCSCFLP
eukprot:CAMPEP_0173464580 /NCGR_PEP_ID=MMETSP1357-20121228/70208_1 /TAXON_ID=77926 /ORGANISM="Hemiselmis rufescens, Strain PCC563" /LENGTH=67 /DNA_ID=CAMNT_0014432499 /DNA_START=48 /DNA_END=247 /DNA_ORIENTATION=+